MWNLKSEANEKRIYVNSATGSKCNTSKVYTDREGNNWYSFEDLLTIPLTRTFAASKVTALYALGLTKDDLTGHINGLKTILKSNDPERYEKAFNNVLDFENKASNATDPLRQLTSLVPVYFMINDEIIDSFETSLQLRKMLLLEAQPEMHAFFLTMQNDLIGSYMNRLNQLSQIALVPQPELPEVLQ